MIEWCNSNAGFATTLLTFVYVVATLVIVGIMVRANYLVREANRTAVALEQQRSRPVVTIDFFRESVIWTLRIKNHGLSVARDIRFNITPEPKMCFGGKNAYPKEKRETSLPLLNKGIPSLPPAAEITAALGTLPRIKESLKSLHFQGEVNYVDESGTPYRTEIDIDLSIHESLTHLTRKGLHEIGKELEEVRKELHHIATGFSKPQVIVQGIKEYRRERDERDATAQAALEGKKSEHAGAQDEESAVAPSSPVT